MNIDINDEIHHVCLGDEPLPKYIKNRKESDNLYKNTYVYDNTKRI